jgi:hypothetical protein
VAAAALAWSLSTVALWPAESQARLPWKTNDWQIACEHSLQEVITRPDTPVAELAQAYLSDRGDAWIERYFGGDRDAALAWVEQNYRRAFEHAGMICDPARSDLLTRIDEQLEWASGWLEELGFSGPAIAAGNESVEGSFFPESLLDCLSNYCASISFLGRNTHGLYYRNSRSLRIGVFTANAMVPAEQFRPTVALDSGNVMFAYTPLHELFHAVQFAYEGVGSAPRSLGWFIEGTARYMGVVGTRLRGSLTEPEPETRYYDHPLHIPPASDEWLHEWKYGSWYFWDFLGAELDSRDGVKYLDTILRHDLSDANGLVGVQSALEMMHPSGLYDLYPAFVQKRLLAEKYFESVSEHPVQVDDRELIMGQRVDPMATSAHRIEYDLGEASAAGLSVRLADDHPDLHLIVDGERADIVDGDGSERNVWRTRVAESGEALVRVANTAPYPPDSEPRDYDLEIRLVPLEPCSQKSMVSVVNERRTFLGPFRAEKRNAHPLIPERARRFVERQTKKLEPGTGRLNVSGVLSDSGVGCSGHVGATSLTGRLMTGNQQATEEYVERLENMAERMEGFVEKTEGADNLSSDERDEIAEEARSMQDAFSAEADGREQTVVFSVYSPNAWVWQAGLLSDPKYVKHSGVGGWRDNAAAHFVVHLVGTTPDDIREGETYEAVALGVPVDRIGETPSVPTPAGFYTRWSGEFSRVPYPPPANADQARRQQRAKADCRHGKRAFAGMRQRMGVGQLLTGGAMEKRDCEFMRTAFAGRIDRVFGNLRGSVTVDEKTGAEIHGRFELSGPASVETSQFTYEYDGEGRLIGNREELSTRSGDLRIEGELRAPNQSHGQARFGWESIVID